jgi:hypothetical protein
MGMSVGRACEVTGQMSSLAPESESARVAQWHGPRVGAAESAYSVPSSAGLQVETRARAGGGFGPGSPGAAPLH